VNNELFLNLRLELRRGCLVIAVLAKLRKEQYGYSLRKALEEIGLEIDARTLNDRARSRIDHEALHALRAAVDTQIVSHSTPLPLVRRPPGDTPL